MEDLSKFTSKQIIERIYDYHSRLQNLMQKINTQSDEAIIRNEYKDLKQIFHEELKYFETDKHSIVSVSNIHKCYQAGVTEAAKRGFSIDCDAPTDIRMLHAVMDADDDLMYYLKEYGEVHKE